MSDSDIDVPHERQNLIRRVGSAFTRSPQDNAIMSSGDERKQRGEYRVYLSQTSMSAAKTGKLNFVSEAKFAYESLEFQDVENECLRERRKTEAKTHGTGEAKWKGLLDWVRKWTLLAVIGVLTGATACAINYCIEHLTEWKWETAGKYMETARDQEETIPYWQGWAVFCGINMAFVIVACIMVVVVEPLAAGSGIPEVKCYLNGVRISRVVRLRTLFAKGVGILFSVASGLPCGKEGPMIHSGAVIGGGIATGKSTKMHCDTGLFKENRGDGDKRVFVTAGAAAGVAAAFGAPVGGVLFAVEEVGSFWNLEMSVQVFFCATFATFTLNLIRNLGDSTDSSLAALTSFGLIDNPVLARDIPLTIVLGALGGIFGALFNGLNMFLTRLRKKYIKGIGWRRCLEVLIINFVVSTTLYTMATRGYHCRDISHLNNNGTDTVNHKAFVKFYGCNEEAGQYNDMATIYFGQTEANIRHMFHMEKNMEYVTLILHFIPYFLLTLMTYGIAVPSGLFLPSLALGATMGRIYGQALGDMGLSDVHPETWTVFGAAAMLGGIVRMTVSLSVILMEASGNASFIIPFMFITCTAKFVGDLFNHGIYDEHIHFQKVPLLENNYEDHDGKLALATAEDVMNSSDVPVLTAQPTVKEVLRALVTHPQKHCFCVTESGQVGSPLRGIIRRRYIMIILRLNAWGDDANSLDFDSFIKNAHEERNLKPQTYELALTKHDLAQRVNLARYMDAHPVTLQDHTPFPRVYNVFRQLGLRHLPIVDNHNNLQGVIARKCLVFLRNTNELEDLFSDPRVDEHWGLSDRAPVPKHYHQSRTTSAQVIPSALLEHERSHANTPAEDVDF